MKLVEAYKELLREEEAKATLLQQCIDNRWICTIDYRGDGVIAAGKRDVEPVAYGISKAGNYVVRAWQIQGKSDTPMNIPNWRLFRMDKIAFVKTNRQPYTTRRPNFNPVGDKTMARVLKIAKI